MSTQIRLNSMIDDSLTPTSFIIVSALNSRILLLTCSADIGSWHSRSIVIQAVRPFILSAAFAALGPASALITALSDSSVMCCSNVE